MLRRLIVGNWKMHNTNAQAESLIQDILKLYQPHGSVELAVAPSFVALERVALLLASTSIKLAAQNVGDTDEGAFTGEISPPMLKAVGCQYVIIGHSERRHLFGETDQMINGKIHAALRHDLLPILCVGEQLEERQANQTASIIQHQLQTGLKGLLANDLDRITIAYEPVWAIGTGHAATVDQAADVHRHIRTCLTAQYGMTSDQVRIIYGGSVSPKNAPDLFESSEINGALIGKACLNSESFVKIAVTGIQN